MKCIITNFFSQPKSQIKVLIWWHFWYISILSYLSLFKQYFLKTNFAALSLASVRSCLEEIGVMKMYGFFFWRSFGKLLHFSKFQKLLYQFSKTRYQWKKAVFLCACLFRLSLFILPHVLRPSKFSVDGFSTY